SVVARLAQCDEGPLSSRPELARLARILAHNHPQPTLRQVWPEVDYVPFTAAECRTRIPALRSLMLVPYAPEVEHLRFRLASHVRLAYNDAGMPVELLALNLGSNEGTNAESGQRLIRLLQQGDFAFVHVEGVEVWRLVQQVTQEAGVPLP